MTLETEIKKQIIRGFNSMKLHQHILENPVLPSSRKRPGWTRRKQRRQRQVSGWANVSIEGSSLSPQEKARSVSCVDMNTHMAVNSQDWEEMP